MNSKSLLNDKLIVQPVFISLQHKHVFMGPCRYGSGEELTYEYDHAQAKKSIAKFEDDIKNFVDHKLVEIRETKVIEWHEDFIVPETLVQDATSDASVDCFLISGTRLISYVSTIIAKRTKKPLLFCPMSNAIQSRLGGIDATAHMMALGFKEMYNALDYDELNYFFKLLRTRKALHDTKILYGLRNNVLSFGVVSSFVNLQDITDRFGTEIVECNGLEFFDDLDNMSEEDNKRAELLAKELVKNANGVHMPAENIVNDCRFYIAASNALERNECNAFTLPCFEMCATRQLNARHLTFCLNHSLMRDEGIPAACAADVGSVIAIDILMNLTRKSPFMGNCMVMLNAEEPNTMRILHDQTTRYTKGYDNPPLPIDYVPFTMGNWGATMRYDYGQDLGDTITMINLSPRMDKIMVATGKITGCDDFLRPECRLAVRFQVADAHDFHHKQAEFGQHFCWVYGDHSKELLDFAKLMGMEAVIA